MTYFPSPPLLFLSLQVWLAHRNHPVKTNGPASLSAGRKLPGGTDCGEQTGVREKRRFTNKARPDPRRPTHPGVCGAAARRKSFEQHNPKHSTKTNKQGHPIFQLEPQEGGRKWISVALPPASPGQAGLTLGKRRRCTELGRLSLNGGRPVSVDVDANDGGARWQRIPATWRLPATDLPINYSHSLAHIINQSNKHIWFPLRGTI